ncbi:MAG: ATP-binding protein [Mangrovibacterium sp.]
MSSQLKELKPLIELNPDSAFVLIRQIYSQAIEANNQAMAWEVMTDLGRIYYKLGYPDSSRLILEKVLDYSQSTGNRILSIKALTELAKTQQKSFDFTSAVANLVQAEKLLTDSDSFDLRFFIVTNLGIVHRKMKDYDNALRYFGILERNYFFQLTQEQRFFLAMNIGNVYGNLQEYTKAEEFYHKAYHELQGTDQLDNLVTITYNLGTLYYLQNRLEKAEEYILKSLTDGEKMGDPIKIERCYRVLGAINYDRGDYLNAEKYYFKSLSIAKEANNPNSILGNYRNLFFNNLMIAEETGSRERVSKGLDYFRKWDVLNDSLYQVATAEKVLELEKQYETEKKNNQIGLLEKENLIKEDELKIQRAQRNSLIFIVSFILVILGIFVYFYYYYRRINRLLQAQSKHIFQQQIQIKRQNEQLQKSVNTQNKLFSIIAHDLRSPLVSISNFSKLINFYLQDGDFKAVNDMARQMDRKNDYVLELTDNLLSWAKSQANSLNPFWEMVSLNEITDECFHLYEPVAADKEITLICNEQEDCVVWADRNMVKTICRNLINNAIKFTPRFGRVDVWFELRGPVVWVFVRDTGVGMSEEKLKTLFDGNAQEVQYGTEGEKSTGLGLSVCKEFVEKMGGQLRVESEPEAGSTFCFTVQLFNPAVHFSQKKKREEAEAPSPSLN